MNTSYIAITARYAMLVVLIASSVQAIGQEKIIRQGNKLYGDQKYDAAESRYGEALEKDPTSEKGLFNQGTALYQQEKYDEALQNFELTGQMFDDPMKKAQAYHNIGNSYFKAQDLDKSIEAYKNALRLNPADEDTRYNLALAQKLKKQQEQQNQDQQDQNQDQDQQNQDQNQDQNDQQDQQDQQNQDQQNQDQQKQDQQNQDQQNQDKQNQEQEQNGQQQAAPQPSKLTKEEVQRLLEALANDENKVQEKLIKNKTTSEKVKIEKDW